MSKGNTKPPPDNINIINADIALQISDNCSFTFSSSVNFCNTINSLLSKSSFKKRFFFFLKQLFYLLYRSHYNLRRFLSVFNKLNSLVVCPATEVFSSALLIK